MHGIVVFSINDPFELLICSQIALIERRPLEWNIENTICKIQFQAIFFSQIISRSYMYFASMIMQHLYERSVKLADVALYCSNK